MEAASFIDRKSTEKADDEDDDELGSMSKKELVRRIRKLLVKYCNESIAPARTCSFEPLEEDDAHNHTTTTNTTKSKLTR